MRPTLLVLIVLLCIAKTHAQSPPGINYQGVARNPDGKPLVLKDIAIRINILRNGSEGSVEYSEIHTTKTNSFGLFTLVIGNGNAVTGDFRFITWADGKKWLRVDMDTDGGNAFQTMGSQEFMSVPYALYAKYSGNGLEAGQGIAIQNGAIVNTGDSDNSPTNEFNTNVSFENDKLKITDGGGTKEVDLSGLKTTSSDNQNLTVLSAGTQRTIAITNGTPATFDVADNDNSPTNEMQDLSISGNTLSLSGDATPVSLAGYLDNTDNQSLALSGTNLSILNGNSVSLSSFLDNTDSQDLRLVGNSLSLTGDPTPVDLSPYLDNTDSQNLSVLASGSNRTINISNGTGTTFSVNDGDFDQTNEIQTLSYNTATKNLSIAMGNSVNIPETQTISEVLLRGNDAAGQKITNLGAPTATTDAATKQYTDAADAAINARISSNYAFKAPYTFSTLLAVSEVTLNFGADIFDDFSVVGGSTFTAPVAGTYVFVLDGTTTGLLASATINLQYAGTKYPVAIGTNGSYNSTFMFRLTAGQTVSVVAAGLGINTTITGSFYGYKML